MNTSAAAPPSTFLSSDANEFLAFTIPLVLSQAVLDPLCSLLAPGTTSKGSTTRRGTALAYIVTAFLPILYFAVAGLVGWWKLGQFSTYERLFVAPEVVLAQTGIDPRLLVVRMAAYQSYNTGISVFYEDYRTPAAFFHHLYTILLAVLVLQYDYCFMYSLFFVAVAEVSSVPLSFVDYFRGFPTAAAAMPKTNLACRALFALSFLAIRVVYWPIVSLCFWWDCYTSWSAGDIAKHSAEPAAIVFLVGNVGLTGLQFMWGSKLVKQIQKMFAAPKKTH